MRKLPLICASIALLAAVPAYARSLPPGSQMCRTKQAMLSYVQRPQDPDLQTLFKRQCFTAATLLNVKRLACEAYICKIELLSPPDENTVVYTLRSYQP